MNIVNPEASYFEQEVIAADIKLSHALVAVVPVAKGLQATEGLVPGAKRPPMGDLKSDLVMLSRTD